MYIQNERIRAFYRVLFLFICEMGLVLQYTLVARIGNIGILTRYYTILSNIICFLYVAANIILRPRHENSIIKGAVVISITVTGLMYHFMLNGAMEAGVGAVSNVTLRVSRTIQSSTMWCQS